MVARVVVLVGESVELRSTDSRGRLSPHWFISGLLCCGPG